MYLFCGIEYHTGEEKYRRTSTPLPSAKVRSGMNDSYAFCVTKLKEHPKRFRIYGATSNVQGILCGNLVMKAEVSDGSSEDDSRSSDGYCSWQKNLKTTPEFYRVSRTRRSKDCFNAFSACKCRIGTMLWMASNVFVYFIYYYYYLYVILTLLIDI